MISAGTLGQTATVGIVTLAILYCLWHGWLEEHPTAPRGGETWDWDDPPTKNPAERSSATTGPVKQTKR